MKEYILKESGDIENIYLPDLWRLKDNFLPPYLPRTQKYLDNSLIFTSNEGKEQNLEPNQISLTSYDPTKIGHKYRAFNKELFSKRVPMADFIEDVREIIRAKQKHFLQDVNHELEVKNETSVKLLLIKTIEQIDEVAEHLQKEIKNRDRIDSTVITILLESYGYTREHFKNRFDKIYPELFSPVAPDNSEDRKTTPKTSHGLILAADTLSPGRAKKLTKWLKEEGFIAQDTQYQTVQNIFVKEQTSKKLSKVKWTGVNKDLKYFINGLQKRSLVIKSSRQTKWKDVVSVFVNEDGQEFENTQFSGNTGSPTEKKKKKLDAIIRKFESEIKESLTSRRSNKT